MAKADMYIVINDFEVRHYGGNSLAVRRKRARYLNMTKEDFLIEHPKWKEEIEKNGFHLLVAGDRNKYWEK